MHASTFAASVRPTSADARSSVVIRHLQHSTIFRVYQQAFETTIGLPLALRALGSFQLPFEGSKHVTEFHALAAHSNRWCAACLEQEEHLERAAATTTATLETFAGTREAAIPVRIGDALMGHLRTGQVCLRPPTEGDFEEVVRQLGVPLARDAFAKLEHAYLQTRVISERQYEGALRLLSIFADYLAAIGNQLLVSNSESEIPGITQARAFIDRHLTEEIRLEDAAHAASMSVFYFCKLFRRVTGLSFTDYLARRRVEAVKEALRNPNTRVCEAAYAAGFQSLSQFNRVFRRVAGETPSRFREGLPERKVR